MEKAVILLSGGIDSTTTLAIAKSKGFDIYAISFNYGQRHFVELDAAKRCAAYFNVKKHLIINFDLREIGSSALTSDMKVPKDSYELQVTSYKLRNEEYSELNSSLVTGHSSLIPVTYVPARNTIFLSFALSWAEVLGAEDIFIGANAVDYSGYPDCRPEFINAFENMANLATKASVEGTSRFKIHAPLISLTKSEIIKKGIELGVDYSMTWSCYDPQISDKLQVTSNKLKNNKNLKDSSLVTRHSSLVPCMRCDSCLLRAKGFKEAGIKDPLAI
ncbi:MAG: 7-cyano-7-deazaguanine synthase QueC [Thermodesulfovibrionia bacterium]|nr:7-cyano-7-deazaguanine synthase QueC [Thermodesulfovibrionia bacterium]